jgi:hypothetical protein
MDPETCAACHPQHYEEWSGSMHAYAAEDPLFLAMNRRGQREAALGDFCVNCHAPMAVRLGETTDGLNLESLPKPLRGVTCYFCHAVKEVRGTHDNPLVLGNDHVMRGGIADPVPNTAHASTYSKLHDRNQLDSATLCGACHDLVNEHGVALERTFIEWQESVFSKAPSGSTCGQCHMDRSRTEAPVANFKGVFPRRAHSHRFPGVDLALTPFPDAEAQRRAVADFLNTTLQSALCVRGVGSSSKIEVILDNVAAGHRFPSGAAQDRRLWVEVTAYAEGVAIYESGKVAPGTAVTTLLDPDLWLIRDCLFDADGREVHMFWEARAYESNLLPAQVTFTRSDPRYYQTHVFQTYPRAPGLYLPRFPDRVSMSVYLEPFGLDVFDDLVASGDIEAGASARQLRDALARRQVGETLEWTAETATESGLANGTLSSCISTTNLSGHADRVPAVKLTRCGP